MKTTNCVRAWLHPTGYAAAIMVLVLGLGLPSSASAQSLPTRALRAIDAGGYGIASDDLGPGSPVAALRRFDLRPPAPHEIRQEFSPRIAISYTKSGGDYLAGGPLVALIAGGWLAILGAVCLGAGGFLAGATAGSADHTARDVGYGIAITGGAMLGVSVPCLLYARFAD